MPSSIRLLPVVCLLALAVVSTANADDAAAGASWEELVAQKTEALQRLQEMVQQSRTQRLTREEAEQLSAEYNALVAQLQTSLYPRMVTEAASLLEQPELSEEDANQIGDLAVRIFRNNQFQEAARLADGVLDKLPENAVALNAAGTAHFALQEFEQAAQLLARADEQDAVIPSVGGPYLDVADAYVEYWRHEQSLRAAEAAADGEQALPRVLLTTSRGEILLELFENEAPNTVANFVNLVEQGYYDGTKFHRVIGAFMAQGGDPRTKEGGSSDASDGGPGYVIDCECYQPNARRHFAGSLSMAHAGRDTGGSQFFITHLPTPHLDAEVQPESVHTVFGRVVEGLDVVRELEKDDEIESATVVRKRNHEYVPAVNRQ